MVVPSIPTLNGKCSSAAHPVGPVNDGNVVSRPDLRDALSIANWNYGRASIRKTVSSAVVQGDFQEVGLGATYLVGCKCGGWYCQRDAECKCCSQQYRTHDFLESHDSPPPIFSDLHNEQEPSGARWAGQRGHASLLANVLKRLMWNRGRGGHSCVFEGGTIGTCQGVRATVPSRRTDNHGRLGA